MTGNRGRAACVVFLLGLVGLAGLASSGAAAPPVNDNFSDAAPVLAFPFAATVDLTDATREPNEPGGCGGSTMPRTAWYRLDVPIDGHVGVDAAYSSIFRGTSLENLEYLGCSRVAVSAGDTVYIRIHAWSSSAYFVQDVWINVASPPANDDFAGRTQLDLAGGPQVLPVNLLGATSQPDEPPCPEFRTLGQSVWYEFVAPGRGRLYLDWPAGTSDRLSGQREAGLYRGDALDELETIRCTSRAHMVVEAGESVKIQLPGRGDAERPERAYFEYTPSPRNDDARNATALGEGRVLVPVRLMAGATTEPGESGLCWTASASLWYRVTMPLEGALVLDPGGNDLDVLEGTSIEDVEERLCAGRVYNRPFQFAGVPGREYLLRAYDDFTVRYNRTVDLVVDRAPAPANDHFHGAAAYTGVGANHPGSVEGATTEPGEPDCGGDFGHTLWYRFEAPQDGTIVGTTRSGYWYATQPFVGDNLDSLADLDCAATGPFVDAGQDVLLQVGMQMGHRGSGVPAYRYFPVPANDHPGTAIALPPAPISHEVAVPFQSYRADDDHQPPEPCHRMQRSIWYTYQAPGLQAEVVTLRIDGRELAIRGPMLAVYESENGAPGRLVACKDSNPLRDVNEDVAAGTYDPVVRASFVALPGREYLVQLGTERRVDNIGAQGSLWLTSDPQAADDAVASLAPTVYVPCWFGLPVCGPLP